MSSATERGPKFPAILGDEVLESAADWDESGRLPERIVEDLARDGHLGAAVTRRYGGLELSSEDLGRLCAELGAVCSSLRSLVTVQSMVAHSIERFGTESLRTSWLDSLSKGTKIAGFALTEADVGSDAAEIKAELRPAGDEYLLTGTKRWVTFGALADVYLVIARSPEGPTAILVDHTSPGIEVRPTPRLLGLRASMVADLQFDRCRVPKENVLGPLGGGFSHVAVSALDLGRFCVAWGCVGMIQRCLHASLNYARTRIVGGQPLTAYALIRDKLARMYVGLGSATRASEHAGRLRQARDPRSIHETMVAKYVASQASVEASREAVQILGANGCDPRFGVERFFRDSKVMELIEGTNEVLLLELARHLIGGVAVPTDA